MTILQVNLTSDNQNSVFNCLWKKQFLLHIKLTRTLQQNTDVFMGITHRHTNTHTHVATFLHEKHNGNGNRCIYYSEIQRRSSVGSAEALKWHSDICTKIRVSECPVASHHTHPKLWSPCSSPAPGWPHRSLDHCRDT